MQSKAMALVASLMATTALAGWTAVLEGVNGAPLRGTATVESVGADSLRANAALTGAAPGSVHPWMVHRGACGAGKSSALVAMATRAEGDFSVQVHKSAEDPTVVACGVRRADA